MSEAAQWLLQGGADGQILSDFRAVAEATGGDGGPRYPRRRALEPLAHLLAGHGRGIRRETPLYELCHLIAAVQATGRGRAARRDDALWQFFLGQDRLSAHGCRAWFEEAAEAGWRRPGFEADGVELRNDDGEQGFAIRYGRMPFLIALYEFLLGMEDFAFADEIAKLAAGLAEDSSKPAIQRASNALAATLRRYRRDHMSQSKHEDAFSAIVAFLGERKGERRYAIVDDASVLDFWLAHKHDAFRLYATAFDSFVTFARAMLDAGLGVAAEAAASLGTDREAAEVDPAADDVSTASGEVWESPLPLLDEPPADAIKFFKRSSERRNLDLLMRYGPDAIRLPLAFLRREVFGAVQSAITTDLQVGRGRASVQARLGCDDATSYDRRREDFEALSALVRRLQLATLHALGRETGDGPAAADAFAKMHRKGFTAAELADPGHVAGFRVAADVLVQTGAQLAAYLAVLARLDRGGRLGRQFEQDRAVFANAFGEIYGAEHADV